MQRTSDQKILSALGHGERSFGCAQAAATVFAAGYGTGWPKAAARITGNLEVLLAFDDYRRRALDPPAHRQPDRVHRRHRASPARPSAQPTSSL